MVLLVVQLFYGILTKKVASLLSGKILLIELRTCKNLNILNPNGFTFLAIII